MVAVSPVGRGAKAHPLLRALCAAIWISLVVYSVFVVRDFYRYVDRAVYVSTDDALANEAYALASQGRYGFLSSPILFGMPRHHGEFSYGPWYFYVGAGLIWLFGYSLTLVRSIHLWTIIGTVVAASCWFRGRAGAVAAAAFGFSILNCFEATQWPMARPDVLGSGFAVALVILAGLALTDDRPRYWFGAGLAAACGAFNHLIAWSLLPSCALLFAVAAGARLRSNAGRRDRGRALGARAAALSAGVLLGVTMFYASFGFRFADQARMFAAYRAQIASPASPLTLIGRHFDLAFGYLPRSEQALVWATLAAGWALIAAAAWRMPAARVTVHRYLLPPLVVWSGYLVSLGWYSNFHKGYAILDQVMAFWTAAAIVWSVVQILAATHTRGATIVSAMLAAIVLVLGVRHVQWKRQGGADAMRGQQWVSIADYTEHLLGQMPARATAWGTVIYGIQTPDRIQLVQFSEGHMLLTQVPQAAERQALAPDFMVWGYPEQRDTTLRVLRGGDALLSQAVALMPGVAYHLDSMVVGAPYGVTRIYGRRNADSPRPDALPNVSVYDAEHRQWLSGIDGPLAVRFTSIAPVEFRIGFENEPPPATATRSVASDLPAGRYLLRVSVTPGAGPTTRRLAAAVPPKLLRQTMGERGPEGDFSSYFPDETTVMLVSVHDGGPLYVSQFDDGAGADIRAVEVFPISGLSAPENVPAFAPLPPLSAWVPVPGVRASAAPGGGLAIEGDATRYGYQIMSPAVAAEPNAFVRMRLDVTVEQGRLCSGVLNGTGLQWIVSPDQLRPAGTFRMDDTSSFRVVAANCNTQDTAILPTRFTLRSGSYFAESLSLYTDRLMGSAVFAAPARDTDSLAGVLTAPRGLSVTRGILAAPVIALRPANIFYRADIVRREQDGWIISGRAQGAYTYLLRMKDRYFAQDGRVLVKGRLERGGVTIGLLRDDQWAAQVNVTKPGNFTVVIAPPARGAYTIVVANDVPGNGADTTAVLTQFGVIAHGGG